MITQILSMVLPVLVMIALGRLCAVRGILNDERHAGLKAIIGDILLPVVLFNAFFTAQYDGKLVLVFVLVFLGCLIALLAGYALRRFVAPYGRFMPLLMTSFEGGMLGYALYALLAGQEHLATYAMVDIGQTMFAYTVFLAALKSAEGQRMTPKAMLTNMLTNKACIGMLLGIVLGALGVHRALAPTAFGQVLTELIAFVTAPTSALILLVVGYQLKVSRKLMRPVLTTMGLRLAVMMGVMALVSLALFAIIPYDRLLMLALMLQYTLPAPFIIPLYADLKEDGEYVSTTLSLGTVLTVVLFFFVAAFSLMG
ncbi:MAG: AEC family transporter [Candidatus Ventricola sp.]